MLLPPELQDLLADGYDLSLVGFSDGELDKLLSFDPEDKQALLEAPSLSTRRETLVTLIEYALRGGGDTGVMQ